MTYNSTDRPAAAESVTWEKLCKLEPALLNLELTARSLARAEGRKRVNRCGNRVWYDRIKPRLIHLVGWCREDKHPVLSTSKAYDTAYQHLYSIMPDCRRCSCFWL